MPELMVALSEVMGQRGKAKNDALLIDAAARGDLAVRREPRWDVYLLNGAERPDIRPVVTALIAARRLAVVDDLAVESLLLPPHLTGV